MARIYANENLPFPVVRELRKLGHDVLTTFESGKAGKAIPDEEVLEFAIVDERILVTINRKHFVRLHKQQPGHTGIIVCSFDPAFPALAQRIHDALMSQSCMVGQLLRINRPSKD